MRISIEMSLAPIFYITKVLPGDPRTVWGLRRDAAKTSILPGNPISSSRLVGSEVRGLPTTLEVLRSTLDLRDVERVTWNENESYANALLRIDSIKTNETTGVNSVSREKTPFVFLSGELTFGDEIIPLNDISVSLTDLPRGMKIEIPDSAVRENFLNRFDPTKRDEILSLLVNVPQEPEGLPFPKPETAQLHRSWWRRRTA